MALFHEGDRVVVPEYRQTAPTDHYGKQGVITASTAMFMEFNEVDSATGHPTPMEDPPCRVRFDGETSDTDAFESWFESE